MRCFQVENQKKNISKSRKIKFVNILLFLLFVGVVVFAYYRIKSKKTLSSRLEAIREAGYPVTFEELDEWYSIPLDEENVAYIILDAGGYYNEPNEDKLLPVIGKAELPGRIESMSEETKQAISQFLVQNQKCLDLLHKTAGLEFGRYPIDFTLGLGTQTFHLSEVRKYTQLLQLEAILAAENNTPDAAFHSIKSIFSVAGSMKKEPLLVSQYVHVACQSLGISSIEYTLNRTDFSDEQILELCVLLDKIEDSNGMFNGVLGERVFALDMLMHPNSMYFDINSSNGSINLFSLTPVLFLYRAAGLSESDSILFLDYTDDVIKAWEIPPYQRQEAAKALDLKINNVPKKHILFHQVVPSFGRTIVNDIRKIARIRAARTALAIQRYRSKYNKLPDSIENVIPDYLDSVPLDPFDGQEIRYKKLNEGYVVYSIGEDQIDDGGREKPKDNKQNGNSTYDITFIIEK